MIEFTKKQIKGIIDILKSEPCKTRPALQTMRVCRDGFIYVTNGYIAIRYNTQTEPIPRYEDQKEFVIPLEHLITWCALSKSKDKLTELSLLKLQDETNTTVYPDMSMLFNRLKYTNRGNKFIKLDSTQLGLIGKATGSEILTIDYRDDGLIHIETQNSDIDALLSQINN